MAEDQIGPLPQANIESAEATPGATEGTLKLLLTLHKLMYQAKPRLSQSSLTYLPIPTSRSKRSVQTVTTRPCQSSLLHPREICSCQLDESGQRRFQCTILPIVSLGNQSLSFPRLISSGKLKIPQERTKADEQGH